MRGESENNKLPCRSQVRTANRSRCDGVAKERAKTILLQRGAAFELYRTEREGQIPRALCQQQPGVAPRSSIFCEVTSACILHSELYLFNALMMVEGNQQLMEKYIGKHSCLAYSRVHPSAFPASRHQNLDKLDTGEGTHHRMKTGPCLEVHQSIGGCPIPIRPWR